ncbi:hypothetical protein AAMO2058_001755300 [Amorphochlora amoebiformis]
MASTLSKDDQDRLKEVRRLAYVYADFKQKRREQKEMLKTQKGTKDPGTQKQMKSAVKSNLSDRLRVKRELAAIIEKMGGGGFEIAIDEVNKILLANGGTRKVNFSALRHRSGRPQKLHQPAKVRSIRKKVRPSRPTKPPLQTVTPSLPAVIPASIPTSTPSQPQITILASQVPNPDSGFAQINVVQSMGFGAAPMIKKVRKKKTRKVKNSAEEPNLNEIPGAGSKDTGHHVLSLLGEIKGSSSENVIFRALERLKISLMNEGPYTAQLARENGLQPLLETMKQHCSDRISDMAYDIDEDYGGKD